MEVGWEMMRTLLVEQWRLVDRALVERYQQQCGEGEAAIDDGHDPLKVVSRLGVIYLPRQVCYRKDGSTPHAAGQHGFAAARGTGDHPGLARMGVSVAPRPVVRVGATLVGLDDARATGLVGNASTALGRYPRVADPCRRAGRG